MRVTELVVNKALCINWLGISAIAAGIARGAVRAARDYASTRYQGGAMIEYLPAIQKLIALSEARMETAHAHLNQVASLSLESKGLLPRCAIAKLMVTDLSFHAVTDSLQVFGGYGYMEDYGMEKRLRDAAVLKSVSGSPNSLELFIFRQERRCPHEYARGRTGSQDRVAQGEERREESRFLRQAAHR